MKRYRNGSDDGWLFELKCGVTKEVLDNGETYYWVEDEEQGISEPFETLEEARQFKLNIFNKNIDNL